MTPGISQDDSFTDAQDERLQQDDTVEAVENADDSSSGDQGASRNGQLRLRLLGLYDKMDEARQRFNPEEDKQGNAADNPIRSVELKFFEFAERYREDRKVVPPVDQDKAAEFARLVDDFIVTEVDPDYVPDVAAEDVDEITQTIDTPVLPDGVIDKLSEANFRADRPKDLPPGVDPHLDSHNELVDTLERTGRVSPETAAVLRSFVELHDLAYSGSELNLERDGAALTDVFKENALATGKDEEEAAALAEKAFAFVSEEDNQNNYLLNKVILHGSASRIPSQKRLEAAGLEPDQAKGLATLFSAHHPGYPITLVDTFVLKGLIPDDIKPLLLIDTEEGGNPDELRAQVADRGSELLGIDPVEGRKIALLGYALDRITPARRLRGIEVDDEGRVLADEKGNLTATGETSKKYPLIVTNFNSFDDVTVSNIYENTLSNVKKERDAAIEATQKLDDPGNRKFEALEETIRQSSDYEIKETRAIQDEALAYADSLDGFSGHLRDLDGDLSLIRGALSQMDEDADQYEAAAYLAATLQSIESSPLAKGKLKAFAEAEEA